MSVLQVGNENSKNLSICSDGQASKDQQTNVVNNAGDQQSRKGVEHADLGGPFDRVRFSRSGGQGTDAGHVEADGEDEGQSLSSGEVGGQNFRDPSGGGAGNLGSEGGADQTAAGAVECIQHAQQRFLGDGRGAERQKCLPLETENMVTGSIRTPSL